MNDKYKEATPRAIIIGLIIGGLMTASFSYAALVLGFSTNGSPVAAILGWGIMRTFFKRSSVLENNIIQTVASALNTATAGVIFTVPILLIRGEDFNIWWIGAACVAGALLGIGFIIPLRRQMIEIDKLSFPSGIAVATILKSPEKGLKKSRLLFYGALIAAALYVLIQFPRMGFPRIIPASLDLGAILRLPPYINNVWAISLLSVGIGYITGKNGLLVLAGGILSYWIITPTVIALGWLPPELAVTKMAGYVHCNMTRPLGIGMLIGGSLISILLMIPSLRIALKFKVIKENSHELSLHRLVPVLGGAFILFGLAIYFSSSLGFMTAILVATGGTLWAGFAGIIVTQTTGRTDWTPISGMSLLAVALLMWVLPARQIVVAVLIGTVVSVAIAQSADMMQDLKTGFLVGSRPAVQQFVQLTTAGLGPVIALAVMLVIWNSGSIDPVSGEKIPGFGPGTEIEAPQAVALGATIDSIVHGDVPFKKYAAGTVLGMLLSLSGIPGLGVIMGIAMYLSIKYILPYGLGSLLRILIEHYKGAAWSEEWGIPFAAGLIVGEAFLVIVFALLTIWGVVAP